MYNPMILKQINNWFAFIYYDHVGFVFCVASRQSKYIMIGLLSTSVGEGTRGERIVFWWPNTNTNTIRLFKNDQIRIRIIFGFSKMTEYEYEYYSAFQKWQNMNTIRIFKIIRIGKLVPGHIVIHIVKKSQLNAITFAKYG